MLSASYFATVSVCMYGNVGVVLRGARRVGRRVGEGWRGESFNQRQLRTFLCSVAKCNWKAFKYWWSDFINMKYVGKCGRVGFQNSVLK